MSLPVVLPGSCCPAGGAPPLPEPSLRGRARGLSASSRLAGGGGSRLLLPGRPLLSLGLLQLLLGGSMVALSFGALSLSSSAPIRNSCPFWAGSSVILSGIVGLTTWRKPMLLLVNVFVLLSVVCVLLNLAGFILCCQGAQLVSSMTSCQLSEAGDVCYCCSLAPASKCSEEKVLELHPAHSCSTMRILLKKVLFALCALNALTTAVCLMAAALRYLQIFTARAPCTDESRTSVENREEPPEVPDPDDFVAPAPPPSYFSTFYSYTPRLACRMVGNSGIPLPHIYGARIKGVEVFCPLDPPPPYEAVAVAPPTGTAQEIELTLDPSRTSRTPVEDAQVVPGSAGAVPQVRQPAVAPTRSRGRMCRSHSDPVLIDLAAKVWNSSGLALAPPAALQTTDSSTQTSQPTLALQAQAQAQAQVTLRRGRNGKRTHPRARPTSMVDYQSYQHTQHLVRKILEQPAAQGLAPEVQELVDSIRNVLQSDQEHMDEAVRCASYIEQVFSESDLASGRPRPEPQSGAGSQTFPRPPCRRAGLLHLPSCGDLSSYTCAALQPPDRPGPRPGSRTGPRAAARLEHPERAHSLIGVFRETVL
ncbi:protein FAM189A2 isoform X1 [Salarias fasciatus]|uniref:protein FAM189A2 isoform X1 n=1 Tax=Salarias fasciatus TaxID=181472 RepID=UPI001176E2C2|nr:protein FAM189A2 isoform X1 [Salarias fasciatus]